MYAVIASKKKGNKGEHSLAHFLESHGIKAFRNSMSGGSIWKGDIANDINLTIEVKTVKHLSLMEAWKQVNRDASIARNTPLLAVHFDHMPKDEWLMVMHSNDLVEYLKSYSKNTPD